MRNSLSEHIERLDCQKTDVCEERMFPPPNKNLLKFNGGGRKVGVLKTVYFTPIVFVLFVHFKKAQ